jgi:hypothetical protein
MNDKKIKPVLEQHYTPGELAKRWGFSAPFIRELFEREEGVLTINRPEKMHKKKYVSLRIPESVAERVYQRLVARKRPTLASVASAIDPLAERA